MILNCKFQHLTNSFCSMNQHVFVFDFRDVGKSKVVYSFVSRIFVAKVLLQVVYYLPLSYINNEGKSNVTLIYMGKFFCCTALNIFYFHEFLKILYKSALIINYQNKKKG